MKNLRQQLIRAMVKAPQDPESLADAALQEIVEFLRQRATHHRADIEEVAGSPALAMDMQHRLATRAMECDGIAEEIGRMSR